MQTTDTIMLVRPSNLVFNPETAASNAFQHKITELTREAIKERALIEFEQFAQTLKSKGIQVLVFDDTPLPRKT